MSRVSFFSKWFIPLPFNKNYIEAMSTYPWKIYLNLHENCKPKGENPIINGLVLQEKGCQAVIALHWLNDFTEVEGYQRFFSGIVTYAIWIGYLLTAKQLCYLDPVRWKENRQDLRRRSWHHCSTWWSLKASIWMLCAVCPTYKILINCAIAHAH